jgi:hypothetical protein
MQRAQGLEGAPGRVFGLAMEQRVGLVTGSPREMAEARRMASSDYARTLHQMSGQAFEPAPATGASEPERSWGMQLGLQPAPRQGPFGQASEPEQRVQAATGLRLVPEQQPRRAQHPEQKSGPAPWPEWVPYQVPEHPDQAVAVEPRAPRPELGA